MLSLEFNLVGYAPRNYYMIAIPERNFSIHCV